MWIFARRSRVKTFSKHRESERFQKNKLSHRSHVGESTRVCQNRLHQNCGHLNEPQFLCAIFCVLNLIAGGIMKTIKVNLNELNT
jgi:hypothetical protein